MGPRPCDVETTSRHAGAKTRWLLSVCADIFNSAYSLLKWMTQVSNLANPPLVHSVSYGNDEKQQTSKACPRGRRNRE